jgi:hypothetical protein
MVYHLLWILEKIVCLTLSCVERSKIVPPSPLTLIDIALQVLFLPVV